jgi:hypothetical protein
MASGELFRNSHSTETDLFWTTSVEKGEMQGYTLK